MSLTWNRDHFVDVFADFIRERSLHCSIFDLIKHLKKGVCLKILLTKAQKAVVFLCPSVLLSFNCTERDCLCNVNITQVWGPIIDAERPWKGTTDFGGTVRELEAQQVTSVQVLCQTLTDWFPTRTSCQEAGWLFSIIVNLYWSAV